MWRPGAAVDGRNKLKSIPEYYPKFDQRGSDRYYNLVFNKKHLGREAYKYLKSLCYLEGEMIGGTFRTILIVSAIMHTSSQSVYAGVLDLLPSWPINDVGEEIPSELIRFWAGDQELGSGPGIRLGELCSGIAGEFSAFPSKAIVIPNANDPRDPLNPNDLCGDGDQTTYNGMLCAAGIKEGCDAVRESQDSSGRWFRSPHRRWMWTARCPDEALHPDLYRDRCAHGFSPDMNLGVLLYVLQTKDRARYTRWLEWLDGNAATTVLCKLRNNEIDFTDCVKVEWPRVCPEDLGYDKDPGEFQIDGRYGGKCALRPPDALDFAAVNDALNIVAPERMSNWEVNSRALMGLADELASAIVPGLRELDPSPLLVLSMVDQKNFPLHLDGVRVLIRMMIRNPDLRLSNLPDLPRPEDLSPGILDEISSDGTDPGSIHLAAKTLADRYPSNPFFVLLADGPSPSTRDLIVERCPRRPGSERNENEFLQQVGNHWLWEKYPEEVGGQWGAPDYSMGWDCVFVGALYNKMRIRKDLADELLDLFLQYSDPIGASLGQADQAAQAAQAAFGFQQNVYEEAQRALESAHRFIDTEYAELRNTATQTAQNALDELARLDQREQQLQSDIQDMVTRAATLPDTVIEEFFEEFCPDWVPGCEIVKKTREIANKAKSDLLEDIGELRTELSNLRNVTRTATHAALTAANQTIADLDIKFQSLTTDLAAGTLDASLQVAQVELELRQSVLVEARKVLADARRAHSRVQGLLAVWRDDPQGLQSVTEPRADALKEKAGEPIDGEVLEPEGTVDLSSDNEAGKKLAPNGQYFTVVGSFKTPKGALRHLGDLKRFGENSQLDVLLPHPVSKYWVVVSTKNTTFEFASLMAQRARKTRFQHDAYVLRLPYAANGQASAQAPQ